MARGRPVVGCGELDKGGDSNSKGLRFLRFSASIASLWASISTSMASARFTASKIGSK